MENKVFEFEFERLVDVTEGKHVAGSIGECGRMLLCHIILSTQLKEAKERSLSFCFQCNRMAYVVAKKKERARERGVKYKGGGGGSVGGGQNPVTLSKWLSFHLSS